MYCPDSLCRCRPGLQLTLLFWPSLNLWQIIRVDFICPGKIYSWKKDAMAGRTKTYGISTLVSTQESKPEIITNFFIDAKVAMVPQSNELMRSRSVFLWKDLFLSNCLYLQNLIQPAWKCLQFMVHSPTSRFPIIFGVDHLKIKKWLYIVLLNMFAVTQSMFHPIHDHSGTLQFATVQTGSSVLTAFN